MYCVKCGAEIKEGNRFCPACGNTVNGDTAQETVINTSNDKSKMLNVMGWILALCPLLSIALLWLPDDIYRIVSYGFLGLTIGLWIADKQLLKNSGYTGKWTWWGFFVIPVYLFFRAKKVNGKYIPFVASILSFVLVIATAFIIPFSGGIGGNDKLFGCMTKAEKITDFNAEDYLPKAGSYKETYKTDENGNYAENGTFRDFYLTTYYEGNPLNYRTDMYNQETGLVEENSAMSTSGYLYYGDNNDMVLKRTTSSLKTSDSIYFVYPGKSYRDTVKNSSLLTEPYYYNVETRVGTYKKCLIMTETESDGADTVCAFAPNVGIVLKIVIDSKNEIRGWIEYAPTTDTVSTPSDNTQSNDMPDNTMIVEDILDSEDAEFWTNGNGNGSYTLVIQPVEDYYKLYMIDPLTYEMPYSGTIYDKTAKVISVSGDAGCREAKLEYVNDDELKLTINEVYEFVRMSNDTQDNDTGTQNGDEELINEILSNKEELWIGTDGQLIRYTKKGKDILCVLNSEKTAVLYRGYLDTDGETVIGMDDGCGTEKVTLVNDSEMNITINGETYTFAKYE